MAVMFGGCPHHIENMIEETLPPENYDPNYISSYATIDEIAKRYDPTTGGPRPIDATMIDTIPGSDDGVVAGVRIGPIGMEVREISDARYPDEVVLQAYIFDSGGSAISGLAPPHFKGTGEWRRYWPLLIDSCNGQAVRVDEFTVEEISEENRDPYAIAFVLDHSGSMGEQRVRRLRRSIALLLRGISKEDNVSLISFTDNPFLEVPLTGDKKEWVTEFDSADLSTYGGGTALYDGAVAGINEVARGPAGSRRVVVLFTDGVDGSSTATMNDVHRLAREKNVALYTIGYGPADTEVLIDLAQYTGGRMYRIYRTREFLDVFMDLYRRLNRYYRIRYRPPVCAGLHTARAFVTLPELGIDRLWGEGVYDRSIITPFDSIGSIVFVNIEFDYNEATIRPESMPRIEEVAAVMTRVPTMRMEVRGHTDDQGEEEYNLELSRRRARSVADRLVALGVARDRLSVQGFGETRPLYPNDSEENRRRNRRTEFVITAR